MFEKFNESARRAIFFSRYEASRVGQRVIESQHVLLGVLRETDAVTTELWRAIKISPTEIQSMFPTIEEIVSSSAELPISEDVKKILAYAIHEAETREDIEVSPCHLVLAVLRVPESDAAQILRQRGVEYDIVSELTRLLLQNAKARAEIEERTPITLRQSHYELLDHLAQGMGLRDPRRISRQSLVLALMDAFATSGAPEQGFSSIEDLRDRIRQALSRRGRGA